MTRYFSHESTAQKVQNGATRYVSLVVDVEVSDSVFF